MPELPDKAETGALSRSRQIARAAGLAPLLLRSLIRPLGKPGPGTGSLFRKPGYFWKASPVESPAGQSRRFVPWRSFVALVLLPGLAGVLYFGFVTSDQFESEVRFAVRGTTEPLHGADALSLFQISQLVSANASQEVYVVANYVRSRPMVEAISKKVDLRAIFGKPGIDRWSRLDPSGTPEDLLQYWRSMVTTSVDLASGVVTVKVTAFSREDAVRLAAAIRDQCEAVADQLLDRMRNDAVERAKAELANARALLLARQATLEQFRHARMQIDPMASAQSLGDTLSILRQDLVNARVQLESARASVHPDAPQIKVLSAKCEILAGQITALEARVTSADLNSPASSILLAEYDRLDVERGLAQQAVELAEKELNEAYTTAMSHHIYLVSFQDPTIPQKALNGQRGWAIFAVSSSAFGLWLLFALAFAQLRDHAV
jgi:capsular polysaccharide transport system permease protein